MSEAIHKPHRTLFLAKTARPCVNAAGSLTTWTDADTGAVTLSTGQHAVVGSENEFRAVAGRLEWRIEPPAKAPQGPTAVQ
mgnify:CR=1 FL=1